MTPELPPRTFGRTGQSVDAIWREKTDGTIHAGDWRGLIVTPADLDRRSDARVRRAAATLGRPFDFVLVRDLLANDLKVGWPLHRLQRFRDERLCRFFVIDAHDALEAEWIAANTPVHGVVIDYSADDMAARYRVFDAAANAGVALIGRAATAADAALQLATPAITATLVSDESPVPSPLDANAVESLWSAYAAAHAEPPKLRGGHPPDYGS